MSEPDDTIMEAVKEIVEQAVRESKQSKSIRLPQLIQSGLIAPPLHLQADYTPDGSSTTFHLESVVLEDGTVRVGERRYKSLSTAASMAQQPFHAKAQGHERHDINGWDFWFFNDPVTKRLQKIDVLRRRYLDLAQTGA